MDRLSGVPKNDKAIFASVTSLMKAQAYELGALPERRKDPVVYQFNLLSIVDADLIRLDFDEDAIDAHPIDAEHYIARYIIGKRETFARIRFVTANAFPEVLPEYLQLHRANLVWFGEKYDGFFKGAVESDKKVELLLPLFHRELSWRLWQRAADHSLEAFATKDVALYWDAREGRAAVTVPGGPRVVAFLNGDPQARELVAAALKKVLRYDGPFAFEEEIPF